MQNSPQNYVWRLNWRKMCGDVRIQQFLEWNDAVTVSDNNIRQTVNPRYKRGLRDGSQNKFSRQQKQSLQEHPAP